jgi:hypothetical protein
MPIGESHFTISYHYITPKDYHFINEKVSDEIVILDDKPEIVNLESSDDEESMDMDMCFVSSTNERPVDIDLKSPEDKSISTSVYPQCKDFSIIISPHEKAIADLALNLGNEELMDDQYVRILLFR